MLQPRQVDQPRRRTLTLDACDQFVANAINVAPRRASHFRIEPEYGMGARHLQAIPLGDGSHWSYLRESVAVLKMCPRSCRTPAISRGTASKRKSARPDFSALLQGVVDLHFGDC
jgi:hypothetical protein